MPVEVSIHILAVGLALRLQVSATLLLDPRAHDEQFPFFVGAELLFLFDADIDRGFELNNHRQFAHIHCL